MPTATNEADGVELHYEAAGPSGEGAPVVLVGDCGFGAWQWGWQHDTLVGPREVVTFDPRGTGRSDPPPAPCTLDALADDVTAVLADHGARRAHVVGAGLGGLVALTLALRNGRVRSLGLLGTAGAGSGIDPEPLFAPPDDDAALRESLAAGLSASFRDRHPDAVDRIVEWRGEEDADRTAWERQRAALDVDLRDRLHEVTDPALVVHGAADAVWPVEGGEALAEGLPRGTFRSVPEAGHLVGVEAPRAVNDALLGFLDGLA
jgi:pimeloyl-ACP methyl ester carboxylesterase